MKVGDKFTERRGPFTTKYVCTREGRDVDCRPSGGQVLTFWKGGRFASNGKPLGEDKEFYCTKGAMEVFGFKLDKGE